MRSMKSREENVFFLDDHEILFLSIKKKKGDFLLRVKKRVQLEGGIVHNGIVFHQEKLEKILRKEFSGIITKKEITLFLPHYLFSFLSFPSKKKERKKKIRRKILSLLKSEEFIRTHSFEYDFFSGNTFVWFLHTELHKKFEEAFSRSLNKKIYSFRSPVLTFLFAFDKTLEENFLHLFLSEEKAYLLFYEKNIPYFEESTSLSLRSLFEQLKKEHNFYSLSFRIEEEIKKQLYTFLNSVFFEEKNREKKLFVSSTFSLSPSLLHFFENFGEGEEFCLFDKILSFQKWKETLSFHREKERKFAPLLFYALFNN